MLKKANTERPSTTWLNQTTSAEIINLFDGDKQYPNDVQSEANFIGNILLAGETGKGNEHFARIRNLVRANDFYWIKYAYVVRAMEHIYNDGRQIDIQSVISELRERKTKEGKSALEVAGGEAYLASLLTSAGYNLESYAQQILKMSIARSSLAEAQSQTKLALRAGSLSLGDFANELALVNRDVEVRLHGYLHQNASTLYDALDAAVQQAIERAQNPDYQPGIPSGLASFDAAVLGFAPSKLYIIAAPSGWGKTAWSLGRALEACRQGQRVLFISFEMGIDEMTERLLCIGGRIDYASYRKGQLSPGMIKHLQHVSQEMQGYLQSKTFILKHMSRPSLTEIESVLLNYQINPGFDIVFIDYLGVGKIAFPLNMPEIQQATLIFGQAEVWKDMFKVPFVCGMQTNWSERRKKNWRPKITDLAYGSAAERVADFVGFIYHEAQVKKFTATTESELVVAKNRCGPGGDRVRLMMKWEPEYLTFSSSDQIKDMDDEDDDE